MPRFVPNPNAGSSLRFTAPTDDYDFVIGEPQTFEMDNTATGGKHSWGIRYSLRIKGGELDGKRMGQDVQLYLHTDNTLGINIIFLMAALGFIPGDAAAEESYKEFTADWDWSFDTDTKEVGEGWKKLVGNIIHNHVEMEMITEGSRMGQSQNVYSLSWTPMS